MKKNGPIRGMTSFEGNSLVVYYYFGASEIWPNREMTCDASDGSGLIRGGLLCLNMCITMHKDIYQKL